MNCSDEHEANLGWDKLDPYALSRSEIYELIAATTTCVFIRNRQDGHTVGVTMGHALLVGEIYALTNTTRSTYCAIRRDPRCCAVFELPEDIRTVSAIGSAEIIDDASLVDKWFDVYTDASIAVRTGKKSRDDFRAFANTAQS